MLEKTQPIENVLETKIVVFHCEKHGKVENEILPFFSTENYCTICEDEKRRARKREGLIDIAIKSGVPKIFLKKRYDDITLANESQKNAVLDVRSFGDNFSQHLKSGEGLFLTGGVGTGKSHLANCLAKQLISKNYGVFAGNSSNICQKLRPSDHKNSQNMEWFKTVSLLIIDEIGVGYNSDFEKQMFSEIINARYEAVLPTVCVSNLNLTQLSQNICARSADRIAEKSKIIAFDWKSWRQS